MSRRSGLGRGLAALIPPTLPDADAAEPDPAEPDPAEPAAAIGELGEPTGTDDAVARTSEPASGADDGSPDPPQGTVETTARDAGSGPQPLSEGTRDTGDGPKDVFAAPLVPQGPDRSVEIEPEVTQRHTDRSEADDSAGLAGIQRSEPMAPAPIAPSAATLAEVSPSAIVANPRQPREVFDPDELANLATSLLDIGVLQPLVVRPLDDGRYELVAGERRLRAAMLAGLATVPVVVRHTEDADLLKEALVENIHRVQLNPLEEGAAYQQLLEDFGVTQEELASRLGRSRPAISNAIRLLQLPTGVQRRVASGVLSAGHAKVLLAIDDPDQQVRLADRIVAEGMSVRATEELVRLRLLDQPGARTSSRRRPATAPGLVELQDDLSDALEARVRISMGAKKGKLAIEFASVDDLERIVSVIANGLERGRAAPTADPPVPPIDERLHATDEPG